MLTVDFDRLGVRPGTRVLDLGCGTGRHSGEALRRGARVTAVDADEKEVAKAGGLLTAMVENGEAQAGSFETVVGDARRLPLANESMDVVIASEVLEHISEDAAAMAELARVLKPGGKAAVSVPRWWPERICWALSRAYRTSPGGHVRIYRGHQLRSRLGSAGLLVEGSAHAHALHSPYWWLKCGIGLEREDAFLVQQYHRFLVWDIVKKPLWLHWLERSLNPLLGKSLVIYLTKPTVAATRAA